MLEESGIEIMRNGIAFVKGKINRSDFQVSVFEWKNEVLTIESSKDLWKVDPKKKNLMHGTSFHRMLNCLLMTDFKFLYLLSDLFCICFLKPFIVTSAE